MEHIGFNYKLEKWLDWLIPIAIVAKGVSLCL
nr:MAG TPA: Protein of unknown function (DUF668) [Caudoviricetes sp.]